MATFAKRDGPALRGDDRGGPILARPGDPAGAATLELRAVGRTGISIPYPLVHSLFTASRSCRPVALRRRGHDPYLGADDRIG